MKIFGTNKILNHPDKISNWYHGDDKTLITVHFDLTYRCNHNCPQCSAEDVMKPPCAELSTDEAKNYVYQLAQMGVRGVIFTGGEPLCHPNLIEIIEEAKAVGLDCGLVTNMSMILSGEDLLKLVQNCTWIRVSVDAGSKEMYKKTHGVGEFVWDQLWKNMKALKDLRGLVKHDCTIGMGYLTDENTALFQEMDKFCHLAIEHEVDYVQFRPYHGSKFSISNHLDMLKEVYEHGDRLSVLSSSHKYERYNDVEVRTYDVCHGINFLTIIGANADVSVCCHWRSIPGYVLGNLRDNSLKQIWANRKEVFEKIDVKKCVPFCICDGFNRILFDIKKPKTHINFI